MTTTIYFHLDVSAVWLMSVWMTPKPNPKTLDDLLANARHYPSSFSLMVESSSVCWLLVNKGEFVFTSE